MRMKIKHEGNARFSVSCRGHRITVDQPADNGGDDAGMTPPELLAASLASCIGFYVARYCQQAKLDCHGLEVDCNWQVGGEPRHIEAFSIAVHAPNAPDKRRKALERVAGSCLIHATLHEGADVSIDVETANT